MNVNEYSVHLEAIFINHLDEFNATQHFMEACEANRGDFREFLKGNTPRNWVMTVGTWITLSSDVNWSKLSSRWVLKLDLIRKDGLQSMPIERNIKGCVTIW